ncbi:MAG TPA: hypothetical protein VMF61_15455 [Candidatus Acidoferrales bacterium]|nr:hypothetical protein [Candidatus Acidoferrales bacterium]
MPFRSILFRDGSRPEDGPEPAYFRDLNLDRIADSIAAREGEFDVKPFFRTVLPAKEDVLYRQEAIQDLERERTMRAVRDFCGRMSAMRAQLGQREKLHFDLQRSRWLLHAVETYCSALRDFRAALVAAPVESRAFGGLREFLDGYVESAGFGRLRAQSEQLASDLASIRYCLFIGGDYVSVRPYGQQPDYSLQLAATFERFRRDSPRDYRSRFDDRPYMNHVEEHILGFVADVNPEVFEALRTFSAGNEGFPDEVILRFDEEVRFYLAYLDHVASLKQGAGLTFCYPELSETDKRVEARETFDLALARELAVQELPVVCNSFALVGSERIFVVSGPNQGGKTTFARTFGQLHHLARIGVPVPGTSARLFLFDEMFTHFEREESIATLRGKLQDDLVRIHDILGRATGRSIIIINEIFSSTTLEDATFLASKILDRLIRLDALCVCVTFLVGITRLGDGIVSLVSEVLAESPDVRTFKVIRATARGQSYARSIAEKYRLTYEQLRSRLRR